MYFPKSQIQPNLYTNGGEFQKITDKSIYTGFYFKTSTGLFYTGKTPNDGTNIQLVRITNATDPSPLTPPTTKSPTIPEAQKIITTIFSNVERNIDLTALNNEYFLVINNSQTYQSNYQNRTIPVSFIPILTAEDFKVGVIQRYFAKKNNELIYLETNKENYNLLINRSPNIAWDLYTPISMLWYIDGGLDKAYSTNKNLASLIERNNKWFGFVQYFKDDFTKFYLES
jgi:hypothetical protein